MPGFGGLYAQRSRKSVVPEMTRAGTRSYNIARPHWKESCDYCGMAVPLQEDCPTEIIDRAAEALLEGAS